MTQRNHDDGAGPVAEASVLAFVGDVVNGTDALERPFEPIGKAVFISGPMTACEHLNAAAFAEAHALLREAGAHEVYDPSWEWMRRVERKMGHDVYLRRCIHELTRPRETLSGVVDDAYRHYHAIVQLEGWQESAGAMTEYLVARACGIRCVPIEELRAYVAGRG